MNSGGIFGEQERLSDVLDHEDLLEARFDHDSNGNVTFIGYTPIPNADPASPNFFILKVEYDVDVVKRKRLPNAGRAFIYTWNNRADYFN